MSATHAIPTETNLVDQSAKTPDSPSPQEASAENPWMTFFAAMQDAPRDVHWEEFMRVMKERPMNQLPIERNIFGEPE